MVAARWMSMKDYVKTYPGFVLCKSKIQKILAGVSDRLIFGVSPWVFIIILLFLLFVILEIFE